MTAAAAAAADAHVPDGAMAAAPQLLGPKLSGRDTVPLAVPVQDPGRAAAQIQRLEQDSYRVVFRRGAYLVLHRPPDQPVHQRRG